MTHDTLIKHLQALKLDGTRIDKIEIEWRGSKVESLKVSEYSTSVVYPGIPKSTNRAYDLSMPIRLGTGPRNILKRMGIESNQELINKKLNKAMLLKMQGAGDVWATKILEYRDQLIENMDLNLMEENG